MKKFFLIFCVFFFASSFVSAQTEEGTFLLGGGASYTSQSGTSFLQLNPNVGFFLMNNYAVGLDLAYSSSDRSTSYAVGPYGRAYFELGDIGKFFGQVGVIYSGFSNGVSDSKFGWSIGAGYAYFLNQSIAIELGPRYSKVGDGDAVLNILLGLQIHFKR